jgi:hypothetical protein
MPRRRRPPGEGEGGEASRDGVVGRLRFMHGVENANGPRRGIRGPFVLPQDLT